MRRAIHFILLITIILISCNSNSPTNINTSTVSDNRHIESPTYKKRMGNLNKTKPIKKKFLTIEEISSYLNSVNKLNIKNLKLGKFKNLKFDKIIAYESLGGMPERFSFEDYDTLTRPFTNQQELTTSQVSNFFSLVNNPNTFGGTQMSCFYPRLDLIFFYEKKVKFQMIICLECNVFRCIGDVKFADQSFSEIELKEFHRLNGELGFN